MIDLDLRLLRYFVVVVRAGGFTAAAQTLHVSQPALSQGVKRLEAIVGADLLLRGTRSPTLTEVGEAFYPEAIELLQRSERAIRQARQVIGGVPVRCGFSPSTPRDLLRQTLADASAQPGLELFLEQVEWGDEETRLLWGGVDLVFMLTADAYLPASIEAAPLRTVRRVAVFSTSHPLAAEKSISIEQLEDQPIIDAASGRDFWLVSPRPGYPMPSVVGPPTRTVDEMLTAVSANRGMAITSETVAEKQGLTDLAFVPISDLAPTTLVVARLRDDRRAQVSMLFDQVAARSDLTAHAVQPSA